MMLALGTVRFGFYSSCMNALGRPILIGVLGYDDVNDPKSFNTVYGMVNLLFSIGAAIGTLLGGKLADKYGRNRVFYLSMIIDLLNVAPMMIAHTAPLLISRVLLGISTGLSSCIYNILLAEVLPSKLRGIGSSIAILFLTSSILISAACQNIWSFDTLVHNWRYLLIYPLLLEIVRVILFPFLFKTDTPRYIYEQSTTSSKVVSELPISPTPNIAKNYREIKSLVEDQPIMIERPLFNETNSREVETGAANLNKKDKQLSVNCDPETYAKVKDALRHVYADSELDIITDGMINFWQRQKEEGIITVGVKELFTKSYRRQFLLGCFLGIANQLCGVPFIILYSTILFDQISGNGKLVTVITLSTNVVTSMIMIYLTAAIGRKPNMIFGSFAKSLGMLLLLIGYKTLNLPLIMASAQVYIVGFCLGLGGTVVIYIGETLPPCGIGIAFSFMWITNGIIGLLIPIIVLASGPMPLLIFFMIFCFCSGIIVILFSIETKAKTPKDIQEEYTTSLIHLCSKKDK